MASERSVTVTTLDGRQMTGVDVPVDEITERWTEIKLSDGTIMRIKQTIGQVIRVPGEWDSEGNPIYIVKVAPITTLISTPDELRKRG
jgi:hypothetical protein